MMLLALALVFMAVLSFASVTNAQVISGSSILRVGSTGAQVTALQQFLAADPAIYPQGLVTGYFGPLTEAAVMRYQCQRQIVCSGTAATTGYGQMGPRTLAAINAAAPIGGSDDVSAPLMSAAQLSVVGGANTGNISWTTSEPARHRVLYGTTFPFLYASAPSVTDANFGTNASITLTGLQPNATYHYVRESTDIAGNVMLTLHNTFTAGVATTTTQR